MEAFFVLISLGISLTILIGSIMGITAHGRIRRLENEIRLLKLGRRSETATKVPVEKPAQETPVKDIPPTPAVAAAKTRHPEKAINTEPEKPPVLPPKPVKPAATKKPERTWEEILGTQWSVWVGGLALFLGAVFLLRYTIESGFFSPAIRVSMAVIFGALLLAAGEFLRRADPELLSKPDPKIPGLQAAYIPGILTAVGIFALLGSVYAAYALYGFIGPSFAFALMGGLSLLGLALGLLHGPSLAALGLAASLVTPLLIQTSEPNAYILYTYLTIVSAAALLLAQKRDWGWLTTVTLFGALAWIFISLSATQTTGTYVAWLGFTGLMYAVSTWLAKPASPKDDPQKPQLMDIAYTPLLACIWAVLAAISFLVVMDLNDYATQYYLAGFVFAAALMVTAFLKPNQSWHVLTSGFLGGLLILYRAENLGGTWLEILVAAAIVSTVFIAACYSRLSVPLKYLNPQSQQTLWSLMSITWPIMMFLTLSVTNAFYPHEDAVCGSAFFALTLIYAGLAFKKWGTDQTPVTPHFIYSFSAGGTYVLALLFAFDGLFESLALMGGIVLATLATRRMPTIANRMITAGFGLLTAFHILLFQITDPSAIGSTVILNALWTYFAMPAILCAGAAWALGRMTKDLWSEGLKALALTFSALFVVFQIRHAMNGGDILAKQFSFEELSLQVLTGLSFTFGSVFISTHKIHEKPQAHDQLLPLLATAISAITLIYFVIGLCLTKAPLFMDNVTITGHVIFNSLILAYLLPAILFGAIAYISKGKRPDFFVKTCGAFSLLAIMFYITSLIRKIFSDDILSIFAVPVRGFELYTMSAVWLLLGIALLVIGLRGKRKDIRLASAVVITLTILKAFLIDMAELEGVLRAVSFVVLGLVLIVIGRAYQRILLSEKTEAQPT